jgi:hypothetical protein
MGVESMVSFREILEKTLHNLMEGEQNNHRLSRTRTHEKLLTVEQVTNVRQDYEGVFGDVYSVVPPPEPIDRSPAGYVC